MPRLLVVGMKVARLKCVDWSEWHAHNLLDYQGLLLDCRKPETIPNPNDLARLLASFLSQGHRIYLILPGATALPPGGMPFDILPFVRLYLRRVKGRTLIDKVNVAPFSGYRAALSGHEIVISDVSPTTTNGVFRWPWNAATTDNVNRGVCGAYGNACVFHPPSAGLEAKAVKAILEDFGPDFEEPELEAPPEWSSKMAAQIPGVAEIDSRIAKTTANIDALKSHLGADQNKRQELERWAEILWLDGLPLQRRVSEALALLGIPNESEDPTAHAQDLLGSCMGSPILFEVTGSTGSIGIEKGRQLHQWIAQRDDAALIKGILVGNAYRKAPPDKRPPSPDHKFFVKEVEDLAMKFHFALVDVRDLFDLVVRKLGGEDIRAEDVCKALQKDGMVTFKSCGTNPREIGDNPVAEK